MLQCNYNFILADMFRKCGMAFKILKCIRSLRLSLFHV